MNRHQSEYIKNPDTVNKMMVIMDLKKLQFKNTTDVFSDFMKDFYESIYDGENND